MDWLVNMPDFPLILLYLVAAALVVFISIKLGDFLDIIDKKSNISGAFLGGILLAAVTSLPELFSSLTATVFVKNNSYVLGNVLGSNLFNLVIFAVIFIVFFKRMVESKTPKSFLISMLFLGILYVLTSVAGFVFEPLKWLFGYFNPISIAIFVVYCLSVWKTPKVEEGDDSEVNSKITLKQAVILFIICAIVLVAASICITYLTDAISVKYHLGASFGGALFLGVATSLPELTATITLCKKRNFVAAYGNILGSCVFNFLILTIGDALSFNCTDHVYRFDQSAFLMLIFTVVALITVVISFILMIKGVNSSSIGARILFIVFGVILLGSYIGFCVLSNINLGLDFAPYIVA